MQNLNSVSDLVSVESVFGSMAYVVEVHLIPVVLSVFCM